MLRQVIRSKPRFCSLAVFALCAGCGGDSAAFAPSETISSGGEQTSGSSAPGSAQSSSAQPTLETPDRAASPAPSSEAPPSETPPQPSAAATAATAEAVAPSRPRASKPASGSPTHPAAPPATAKPEPAPPQSKAAPAAAPAAPGPTETKPAATAAAQPAAAPVARVIVELKGLESDSGKIQAALFRTPDGFPEDPNKAAVRKLAKISGKKVDLSFDVEPPGTFVVLVHHDQNGDSKMQRGILGQPAEGWGATRDPSANFGPPSFDDAKLTIQAGETKRVVIKLRY